MSASAPAPSTAPAPASSSSSSSSKAPAAVHSTVLVGGIPYTATGPDAGAAAEKANALAAKDTPSTDSTKATLAGKTTSTGSAGGSSSSTNGGTNPTLVTSGSSRTTYANNATSLQNSLANVNANPNVSVVDYLNKSGMPSDYASRAVLAEKNGITGYTGSAQQNMQLLSTLQTSGDNNTKTPQPPMNGSTQPTPQVPSISPGADGATPTTPTTGADGATTGAAGTTPTSNPDGTTTDPNDLTSGLPPAVASAFKDVLSQQELNIQQAQNTLAQAKATMMHDPAATAAATMIESQYSTLIQAMQAKNNMVLGSYRTNAARSGSLQYANDMETNFMSEEMDAASMRLADLVTKESELVLKSNTAYQTGDVKAFNEAQTAVEKATNDKQTTLGKLLTATNNQVKAVQAQQKLDQATKKNQLSSDVTTAAKIADGMAQEIADSGTTGQNEIDKYVEDMAASNDITNVDILKSALVKAQQTATKAGLQNANIRSTIAKRGTTGSSGGSSSKGGGTDGSYKYSADDVSTYSELMNKGGNVNGSSYSARGKDGFVDPGTYNASYEDWIANGGTPTGFAKKFPVKGNINPASYNALPAAIQPKAATTPGTTYPVTSPK